MRSIQNILKIVFTLVLLSSTYLLFSQSEEINFDDYLDTGSGLKVKIIYPGQGGFPQKGDQVLVHYTGKLMDGTVFDSSVERKKPITFSLGIGQVIKGWDEGIALLQKNGQASFVIPPELAYGERGQGKIPPNATLLFEVQLLDFKAPPKNQPKNEIATFDTKGKDTLSTASGLQYIIVEKGAGKKVKKDCQVQMHYSGYLTDGKLFDSTFKRKEPFKMMAGAGKVLKGLEEAAMLMREGDKIRFILPPHLGFGQRSTSVIPANSTLIFDIEMHKVDPPIEIVPFDIEGKKQYSTESGLKYYVVREGKGAQPKIGETVDMHYTGYLQDGTIFDSSVKRGEPLPFTLGKNQVIKGWEEAAAMMNVGDKLRIILPSHLAYGNRQMGQIPANATLIFDIELMGIKK